MRVNALLGHTYYVQVMSDVYLRGEPELRLHAHLERARDITGNVLTAAGLGAPGVLVRACLGATCLDTTTDGDGGYAFVDVAPGVYVVRALPTDPSLLAVQASADATQQSVRGVDLRLTASGGGLDRRTARARSASPAAPAARCTTSRPPTASSLGSGDVADGAGGTPVDGVYTIDITSLEPGPRGDAAARHHDHVRERSTETQTAVLFADPSGTVVDDNAGGARARRRDGDAARRGRERRSRRATRASRPRPRPTRRRATPAAPGAGTSRPAPTS